ncbi:hypothetical protein L1987_43949 [Smallanthus sonchifolius]|uniref:Uncharacterized protein n=1 Tax=Smallanthus sonchifolius TaxID=185202 RepID=A0ACB9GNT8_9ASTR|nr:hypothetical protein L1987_43949 [Smallanthus sonchifolius]
MTPPSCAPNTQAGVDDIQNQISPSLMMKIAEKPNAYAKEDGDSRRMLMVKSHWKPSEDVKLRDLVALHGPRNWNLISEHFPGRSGKAFLIEM